MENLLITGGSGFIGSHFVKHDASYTYHHVFNARKNNNYAGIDAQSDVGEIKNYLINHDITCILHLATYFSRHDDSSELRELIDANVLFGLKILAAAAQTGVRKFVYAGSFYEYSECNGTAPKSLYAASKKSFDIFAEYYARNSLMVITKVVLTDTYGPGDTRGKIVGQMLNSYQSPIRINNGSAQICPTYIKDTCSALKLALLSKQVDPYEIYSIWPDKIYNLFDVALTLKDVIEHKVDITFLSHKHNQLPNLAIPDVPILPKWKQAYDLEAGLRETIALNDD